MSKNIKLKGFNNIEKKLNKTIKKAAEAKAIEVLETTGIEIACPFCNEEFTATSLTVTCPSCSKTIDVGFNVN